VVSNLYVRQANLKVILEGAASQCNSVLLLLLFHLFTLLLFYFIVTNIIITDKQLIVLCSWIVNTGLHCSLFHEHVSFHTETITKTKIVSQLNKN